MHRLFVICLLLFASLPTVAYADQVVLVVDARSAISSLDTIEMRKLFLGWPVFVNGMLLRPIRNVSDPQLQQIFFQQVVAMSQESYDRSLLAGVLKKGRPRPQEMVAQQALLDALHSDRWAVTYMWKSEVDTNAAIRILRVIW